MTVGVLKDMRLEVVKGELGSVQSRRGPIPKKEFRTQCF